MTREEKLDLLKRHYALNGAGDYRAARELLTDDFFITIPSSMPFGGTFRGKDAFVELIPRVVGAVVVTGLKFVETTIGDECAIEIVEFTFAGNSAPTYVAELIRFRGNQICEIQPFYSDAHAFIAAAERKRQAGGQMFIWPDFGQSFTMEQSIWRYRTGTVATAGRCWLASPKYKWSSNGHREIQ